jgi:hydroxyacylglutathione hydrolase
MELRFGPVVFVPGANSGRYPHCHSLYVDAGRKVLIDPASDLERLTELRADPGVDEVWLSHWHEDHFMYLGMFDDEHVRISRPDALPLQSLDGLFEAYGMNEHERRMWAPIMTDLFRFKPRHVDKFLGNDHPVDLGGVTVDVIPTPGHTPGHCSFFFREPELLFLGDYDLTPFGPWYGDEGSDIDETIESVRRLSSVQARVWIASHEQGLFREEPGDLWDRYLKVIDEREEKLVDLLHDPRTMTEIVDARIVYLKPREPKHFFDFGERRLMGKHLERLIKEGAVVCDGDRYRRT